MDPCGASSRAFTLAFGVVLFLAVLSPDGGLKGRLAAHLDFDSSVLVVDDAGTTPEALRLVQTQARGRRPELLLSGSGVIHARGSGPRTWPRRASGAAFEDSRIVEVEGDGQASQAALDASSSPTWIQIHGRRPLRLGRRPSDLGHAVLSGDESGLVPKDATQTRQSSAAAGPELEQLPPGGSEVFEELRLSQARAQAKLDAGRSSRVEATVAARAAQENEITVARRENEALHGEVSKLLGEETKLRRERDQARLEEGLALRHMVAAAHKTAQAPFPRRSSASVAQLGLRARGGAWSHQMKVKMIALGSAIAALALVCCCCCGGFSSLVELVDFNEEEEVDTGRGPLQFRGGDRSRASSGTFGFWCCTPTIIIFLFLVLLVTASGGVVMWETGLLQPIISQIVTYLYGILLLGAFISLMLWELWWLVRNELNKVREIGSKAKAKIQDIFDDGGFSRAAARGGSARSGAKPSATRKWADLLGDGRLSTSYEGEKHWPPPRGLH